MAIVAVNLLGLGDDAAELARICNERRILLIQDSAQHLPREREDWPGDYIVLSFGRGKPLNLLHGGALISATSESNSLSVQPARDSARARLLGSSAAALAFNALTRPTIYRILSALPGTGLGDVTYKPLARPELLPERAWRQVGTAFELYREKPSYRRDMWAAAVKEWSNLGIVALTGPAAALSLEPLRLPLLAPNRAARDALVDALDRSGSGASRFYDTDLTSIHAIPETVSRQGPFPNARELAGRLFTLPTHELVTSDAVRTARELVLGWHAARMAQL